MSAGRGRKPTPEDLYTTPELCERAGVTHRQADYWTRRGWLRPSNPSRGSGTHRYFDAREVLKAAIIGRAGDIGIEAHHLFQDDKSITTILEATIIELKALYDAAAANYL